MSRILTVCIALLLLAAISACSSTGSKAPGGRFVQPVDGLLTSSFSKGGFGHRKHDGVDIASPAGKPVRAIADGRVTEARRYGAYGLIVRVEHDGGWESMYAHLSALDVRKGQRVKAGAMIGKVGATGNATGPHLHLEIAKNDRLIDPEEVLSFQHYRR